MSQMPLPKYHQIYLVLREQLDEGRFADGLPGELALMEQFGVARVTVRRALERLVVRRPDLAQSRPAHAAGAGRVGRRSRATTKAASAPTCAACWRTWSPWACAPPSR